MGFVLIEYLDDMAVGLGIKILKTYVPAGKVCAPTPGTSTGPLKVITVFPSSHRLMHFEPQQAQHSD